MKQRAGLGKKVSSIFDGVPLPKTGQESEQAPTIAEPQLPPMNRATEAPSPPRPMPAMPQPPRQIPVTAPQMPRTAGIPQSRTSDFTPIKKTVSHVPPAADISDSALQRLIHKMFFSGNSEADGRNKRAILLAVVLLAVLAGVVYWTGLFAGSSPKGGIAKSVATANAAESGQVQIAWAPPEPYPAGTLRDPMQIGSVRKSVAATNGSADSPGGVVVKSIVFSKDNPTAVISGQIVRQGEVIEGTNIKVVKIDQASVEFNANGKSWKQQVE